MARATVRACEPGPEDWQYWSKHYPGKGSGKVYHSLEAFIEALQSHAAGTAHS